MKLRGWITASAVLISGIANAQSDCSGTENKKAEKLYHKSLDKKKYTRKERAEFLRESIELDSSYVDALFSYTDIVIKKRLKDGESFANYEYELKLVIEECSDAYASPYFYLGIIKLKQKDYSAAAHYFDSFLKFPTEDRTKLDKKYSTQVPVAEQGLKDALFFKESYANPKPFKPVLITPISTLEKDEYLPAISPDNEVIYFTRKTEFKTKDMSALVKEEKKQFEEIFVSAPLKDLMPTSVGEPMPSPFNSNTSYNYGGATISADGKELYYTVCKYESSGINCDIYGSKFITTDESGNGSWTKPQNLGPNINGRRSWEAQPSLSSDGQMLLFATLRDESAYVDIYVSNRMRNGQWGPAKPIGAPINTEKGDKSPFFHSDSRTLYFASEGHTNFGGYDVFYCKLKPNGTWTEPENIGYPINNENDQHGFVISADGNNVYYGDKMPNGKYGIYSFNLYEEAQPEKVVVLKGKVEADENVDLSKAKIEVYLPNEEKTQTVEVDAKTGEYTAIVNVKNEESLVITTVADDIAYNNTMVEITEETFTKPKPIEVKQAKVGGVYTLESLNYKTNSAELTASSQKVLKSFIVYLKSHPEIRVSIEGHTDNVGAKEANLALSTERAFMVMLFLQENGIAPSRLEFKGWGDAKPITSNSTAAGRATNRRTEFVILK